MANDELEDIRRRMMDEIAMGQSKVGTPVASGAPVELNDTSFDAFLAQNEVVFVDFWAPWCAPCRMVAPVVEKLASELKGKVSFGKLNVDDNPQKSAQFRIMSIPTMMIFHKGRPVDMVVGAVPRSEIVSRLQPFIHE